MMLSTKILARYIVKEFSFTLLTIFAIFFSLFLLIGLVEEMIFFKETISKNLLVKCLIFTLVKIPSKTINFLPFIFLFSGIFFFVKFIRRNEIAPIKLSGLSDYYIVSVAGLYSMFIGILFVIIVSPIASGFVKYYEVKKQNYSKKYNLVVISSTGLWLKESNDKSDFIIVRADKINDNQFKNFNNVTMYHLTDQWDLIERIDSKNVEIKNYNWSLSRPKIINNSEKKSTIDKYNYVSSIKMDDVKNFFSNPDAYSIWNILSEINNLKSRGYSPEDFIIKLNQLLSLPFLLFAMIILSTVLTINLKNKYNNSSYIFYGIFTGILFHYLSDLSFSMGKAGSVPLIMSVWIPIFLIITISSYSLIQNNEKN